MNKNEQHFYANITNKSLRSLFNNPFSVLLSHWIFQGLLYMDSSERFFKIGLGLVSTLFVGSILTLHFSWPSALLIAFILSHTLNFLFNGHLWSALRFFGLVFYDLDEFKKYQGKLSKRIYSENSFIYAATYGSVVREEWDHLSDLDIRLVRRPGVKNCMRACTFVCKERARAFINVFPLDIYVFDDMRSLNRMRADEVPQIIKNMDDLC
jgi:predicted nucleotidyltransferase